MVLSILKSTIAFFRKYWVSLILAAVIITGLPELLFSWAVGDVVPLVPDPDFPDTLSLPSAVFMLKNIVSIIPMTLLEAIIVLMVFNDIRHEQISLLNTIKNVLPILPKALLVGLLSGIAIFVGLELLVIPGVLAGYWLYLVVPVAVVEKDLSFGAVFKRSRALVRGYFWQIVGIVTSIMIPLIIAIIIVSPMIPIVGTSTDTPSHVALAWPNIFFGVLANLFYSIAVVFVYLRLAGSKQSTLESTRGLQFKTGNVT